MWLHLLLLLSTGLHSAIGIHTLDSSDEHNLAMWFGDQGRCGLTVSHDNCSRTTFDYTFSRRTIPLVTHYEDGGGDGWSNFLGHCCNVEIPLQNRGFLNSTDGLINAYQKPVMNWIENLVKSSISTVVHFGDSMTAQTNYAFVAELRRECLVHNMSLPNSIFREETKILAHKMHLPSYLVSIFRWSNVTIFYLKCLKLDALPEMDKFLKDIETHYASPVLIAGNVGLHYPRDAEGMYATAEMFIQFMTNVHRRGKNIALMTETTPTHFNSDDGSFEHWQTPHGYDMNTYNKWDREYPLYHCRALSANVTNRVQNEVLRKVLTAQNLTDEIQVVETFRHLAPYHNMHYGNCHPEGGYRFGSLDCVHFCAFSPLMWTPIWRSMEHALHKSLRSKELNLKLN